MPDDEKKLGRTMLEALDGLTRLIPEATEEELPRLRASRRALLRELGRLVDVNLDAADAHYQAATAALELASATVELALQRMATVAEAIVITGQALELVATLKP
jgi:hypothetical protein